MSSCLPFCSHQLIQEIITSLSEGQAANSQLQKLKEFAPELTTVFVVAEVEGFVPLVCAFVSFFD